jgi:hypothetical protein
VAMVIGFGDDTGGNNGGAGVLVSIYKILH